MAEVQVGEVRLHYDWHDGPGADTPVAVLVNGLLTDATSWRPHLTEFQSRRRVLTYDCRGQGRSDKPDQPYPPRLHALDLAGLLERLDLEQVDLVGLSSGAVVILEFAARWPERVRSMVLSNGYLRADRIMRCKLASWRQAMRAGGAPLRFDVATPWVWGRTFLEANWEGVAPYRDKAVGLDPTAAGNLIDGAADVDIDRRSLAEVTAPALVVVGDEDVLTPRPYAEEIVRALPGARLFALSPAGHAAPLERPRDFARAVLAFWDDMERR